MTSIDETLSQAVASHRAGHLAEAEAGYAQVLATHPDHPDALHLLGVVSHRLGRSEEAIRLLTRAADLTPNLAPLFFNLGNVLNDLRRHEAAARCYRRAVDLDPRFVQGFAALGQALQVQGLAEEARAAYARVRSLKARDAFNACVSSIALETFSYCNRRCSYCPNATHDRLSDNKVMEPAVFDKILRNLGEIDYKGTICFNGYNEPLSDPVILEHIAETRRRVPRAILHLSTNGDYLDRAYLEKLHAAGLNRFYISIHLKPNETYTDSKTLRRIEMMEKALMIRPTIVDYKYQESITLTFPFRDMLIEMRGIDWHRYGTDRGGLVEGNGLAMPKPRKAACYLPLTMFTIQFNGNVTPCCQVIGDVPEHQKYVIGNIKDHETIFDLYASEQLSGWRRHLNSLEPKMTPCDTCSYGVEETGYQDPAIIAKHTRIMDHFGL